MLVLSRRQDEEIVIDGRVRIRVLTGGRGKVRLGITAPADVRVERLEVATSAAVERLLHSVSSPQTPPPASE